MKMIKRTETAFALMLAVGLILSCRDDNKIIYDTSKLPAGAYARMLNQPPGDVDMTAFDASSFPFQAEVVGVGSSISAVKSLDIEVRYLNDTSGVVKDYVALGSITSWTVNSATGLPNGNASYTGAAVRAALGLAPSDLKPAFQFQFATSLKMSNGAVYNANNLDPNLSGPFYNATYDYLTVLDNPAQAPALSWRNGNTNSRKAVPLNNGAVDTLDIVFNKAIATVPAITITPAYATASAVVYNKDKKDTKTKYYTVVTGAASGTGTVTVKVAGAVAVDNNTMASASTTRAIDNQPPAARQAWSTSPIGRGQSSILTLTFNEPMSAAPKATITGHNLVALTDSVMSLSAEGLTATLLYAYKNDNVPDNTSSGAMTLTLSGGADLAGNALLSTLIAAQTLSIDVTIPGAPSVTPDAVQYDWGTQLKLATSVSGYASGTVYFIAVNSGTAAPAQATATIAGLTLKNGFDVSGLATGDIALTGSFALEAGPIFVPFLPKGTFDVYFYFVSETSNTSPNTTAPVTIVMN